MRDNHHSKKERCEPQLADITARITSANITTLEISHEFPLCYRKSCLHSHSLSGYHVSHAYLIYTIKTQIIASRLRFSLETEGQ